jgi:ABC-type Na+ transport system, ATPase component
MIRAHDLHKSFKTKSGLVKAVSGVGFDAHDGQITGLLGQRRRQDHHPAHALHPDRAPIAATSRSMASTRHATRWRCGARWACCRMRAACTSA